MQPRTGRQMGETWRRAVREAGVEQDGEREDGVPTTAGQQSELPGRKGLQITCGLGKASRQAGRWG